MIRNAELQEGTPRARVKSARRTRRGEEIHADTGSSGSRWEY